MSLSVGSNPSTKQDSSSRSHLKSSPKPMKMISKGIIQPITYGARMSAKLIGRRVSMKHKNYGSVQQNTNPPLIRKRGTTDAIEANVEVGTPAAGNNSLVARLIDDEKPADQCLSSLRSQGDDQDLSAGENGIEIVLHDLDESYHHSKGRMNVQEHIVFYLERYLRTILLLIGTYLLGVYEPFIFIKGVFSIAGPIIGVAWCTCLLIQLISWWMSDTSKENYEESPLLRRGEKENSRRGYARLAVSPSVPPQEIKQHKRKSSVSTRIEKEDYTELSNKDLNLDPSPLEMPKTKFLQPQHHPELEDLCIINELTMERGYPNGEVVDIDNPQFQGSIRPMFRTSDIDDANDATSNHFKGKRRYFEMQVQFKMKSVPKGQIFMAFEMDEPIKLGMIQRAMVGAVLNFMKKRNQGLTADLSGEEERADGAYVKPHISIPLETCADLFIITRPGEEIPQLGTTLYEDPEIQKMRKKGKHCINYNTEDTYTVSIWSAYVDFIQWRCLNLPAIRPFSLSSVMGNQTFRMAWYLADPSLSQHRQCDVDKFISFEFGHRKKSRIGPSAKIWMQTMGAGLDLNSPLGNRSVNAPVETSPSNLDDDDTSTDTEQCEEVSLGDESSNILIEDTGTLEELGEGLYLNSGDPIHIRESVLQADPSFFTNAGGYAVLQSQTTASTIIVEKVFDNVKKRVTSSASNQSKLIKNGDTVMISLIEEDQNDATKLTRYLTVHSRWWLKWQSHVPRTNGHFQIFTNEMEEMIEIDSIPRKQISFEAQSSYVRLGGKFQLRVDDKGLRVGVRMESSPTFGGRVMGLYKEHGSRRGLEDDDLSPQLKGQDLIKPLYLCASLRCSNEAPGHSLPCNNEAAGHPSETRVFSDNQMGEVAHTHTSIIPVDPLNVDAPAWLEIMHRRDRSLQLLYLVRISKSNRVDIVTSKVEVSINGDIDASDGDEEEKGRAAVLHSCVRLRTGKNLAPALRLSLDLNSNADLSTEGKGGDISSYGGLIQDSSHYDQEDDPVSDTSTSHYCEMTGPLCANHASDPLQNTSYSSLSGASGADIDSDESIPFTDDNEQVYNNFLSEGDDEYRKGLHSPALSSKKFNLVRMSKAGIGKAAKGVKIAGKGVKIGTVMAGKGVKIGTVMAGKGVMKSGKIVGQTMLPMKSRGHTSPPVKEPRLHSKKNQHKKSYKKSGKDHHRAVNKTLTEFRYDHTLLQSKNQVMAGQLTVPGQSCRIVSHILSELSSIAKGNSVSGSSIDAARLLSSQLVPVSEFDLWFLRGGAVELGVDPMKNEDSGNLLGECVVARCLWESHWREEACLIYDPYVVFYAPLSKKPCLKLSYIDIQQIRLVQASDDINPIPGFPLISIETAWRCHYIAFIDEEGRSKFQETLNSAIFACPQTKSDVQNDELKANMWKDFQLSSEISLSRENGKWASVMSSKRPKQRIIHNNRRMAFDSEIFVLDGSQSAERAVGLFVEDLLRQVLSFSLEALKESQSDFVRFLDCSSRLRTLPLQKLNLSGKEAFCICVNLYHCLLQHSLLLSPYGSPTKRTIQDFMRTNCYEIGADVFSLAELQMRVIRGNMSKAIHPRSPFVQAPKKSRAHLAYALGEADPRINFVLNTGDTTKPSSVPILTPDELDEQLCTCSTAFLREQVSVDLAKRTVTLPKVCEVYRNDFGDGDANCCVHYCLQYLDDDMKSLLLEWLKLGSPYIRYHHPCDRFHSRLQLLPVASA